MQLVSSSTNKTAKEDFQFKAKHKNPEGGLSEAGRKAYNRETGGDLKRPQPEGGARRDSFCARMKGMKEKLTSAETANDPDSRINKSLRKWKCSHDLSAAIKLASKPGLWANIQAKRKRGEPPAKPGDADFPDAKSWKKVTQESEKEAGLIEGIPASEWLRRNKARQAQETRNYNANNGTSEVGSVAPSMVYNSTSGQMMPRGANRYTGSVPATQRQAMPSAPKPVISAGRNQQTALTPEQQKTLNAYRKTQAGQFQNQSSAQIRQGVISDSNYRRSRGLSDRWPGFRNPFRSRR